ncbi:sensor histidine kinase KdpD [Blastococcus sp. LR1]|uniref:sensor histidine kinase n=1 Tax=Blastococcus sp. LR1 TaxID=2877000 RepID=UPI001CCAB664|nr:HAMP domain-containing sensor histidine kinase [Blastococcus sp. LR1]MCA0145372.1 HAMP domain-containing histidine kinase [Blastococcus sp. LR1]
MRIPWWPSSLRGRVTSAFTAVAVVLSLVLAVGVWLAVSRYLLLGRERATLAQTTANGAQVQRAADSAGLSPEQLLSQLPRENGSTSLLADDDRWITSSLGIGRDDLPADLRRTVLDGTPARQRFVVEGQPVLAIGLPLQPSGAAYFEVFPLEELDHTYRVLAGVLAAAVIAVVPVSLLVGSWATRPTLRPLDRVAGAATAVAGGDLTVRIDPHGDPSLIPIARSFNATVEALQDRVRRDARFAADVSHELRSPLTTMLTSLAFLEAYEEDLPDDGREGLAMLRAEVTRFERLVADLLEISRADAGGADTVLEEVNLAALVRESLDRQTSAPGRRGLLTVAPEADVTVVQADKRRLERVLRNLVENADKHGGGVTAVRVEAGPDTACVLVEDAGPGIPESERSRIFERFARGRDINRARTDGAGLGLSLVARHVAAMGGTVTVSDSPAGGARFTVRLPLRESSCG